MTDTQLFNDNDTSPNGCVSLSGYFMNPSSVLIVNSDTFNRLYIDKELQEAKDKMKCIGIATGTNWKKVAEESIRKIKLCLMTKYNS